MGSFAPYVSRFDQLAQSGARTKMRKLRIYFGTMSEPSRAAECGSAADEWMEIVVNLQYWDHASEPSREGLMFHELAHCLLDREHTTRLVNIGGRVVPESLMHPIVFSDEVYTTFREYYVRELFLHIPPSALDE